MHCDAYQHQCTVTEWKLAPPKLPSLSVVRQSWIDGNTTQLRNEVTQFIVSLSDAKDVSRFHIQKCSEAVHMQQCFSTSHFVGRNGATTC
ncbi:unnamed protein product [Litomosoides sigmodontis]|uniref:Uncharacterized protein n=1 Tax=Litomosoides sigmodontis TaxID=42156 RepID=A0A3P6U5F6_LITSI|nr:unnamed protein product [Litomosoides sigmodontis]